ncbi:MAG: response regulator transcription factor, partial [Gillisia sp.]
MKKTITIVDDHTLFAQSLKRLINSFENYRVIDIFGNGKELIDDLKEKSAVPDLILLDIRMPLMDGIQTMTFLKENYPKQRVLALSMEHDEETIIKMIRQGC